MTAQHWRHGDFEISTDPGRFDLDVIHGFLTTSYWSPGIPRGTVERAIRGSLCFGLFKGSDQVGFARVITDRATFAYLADVFVLDAHRGHGLSKWLMACITAHPELRGLRRWSLCTRDAHGLYRKFGFVPPANPDRYMERLDPTVYQREARTPSSP